VWPQCSWDHVAGILECEMPFEGINKDITRVFCYVQCWGGKFYWLTYMDVFAPKYKLLP